MQFGLSRCHVPSKNGVRRGKNPFTGSLIRYVRFGYEFESKKAVHFFDTLLNQHINGGGVIQDFDLHSAVVISAHKFRSFAYRPGFATCDYGCFAGEKALEAAKQFNDSLDGFYEGLAEFKRSYMMSRYRQALIPAIEKKYSVVFIQTP